MPELTIDGRTWVVPEGRNVLAAALDQKLDLPYFCWHPAMGSVGACRLCAVKQYRDETDQDGRIVMACMTPVNDDTRVSIADPEAARFRRSVIEWLMINHPHDCPVCDEGGECHLQDMTVMTGHSHRRYRGRKRTFRNQYLGPLIHHEMNRCITCYRCTRFYQDHAGGDDLRAFASRDRVYFGRVEEGTLESPFSGNLVEVCPTGVFTDRTYRRHYARKWDLQSTPSVCTHCGLGCNTLPAARYGTLRRVTSRYNHEVNGYWLCDRGRFGYEHVTAADRLTRPRLRDRDAAGAGEPAPAEPLEAWDRASRAVGRAAGRGSLAAVGSPRAALESNFALQTLVGPERFCPGTATPERRLLERALELYGNAPLLSPSLREIGDADAVLVLGADPTGEAPLVDMALVKARKQGGARLALVHGRPTRLASLADVSLCLDPDEATRLGAAVADILESGDGADSGAVADLPEATRTPARRIARWLAAAERPLVVTGTGARRPWLLEAAARVALGTRPSSSSGAAPACRLATLVPEPDSFGVALLDDGRGPDLEALLDAIEAGAVDTLLVLENDLFARTDDPERLVRALRSLECLVVLDHMVTATAGRADVALPVTTAAESNGTFVSSEGRAQRFWQAVEPPGDAARAWSLLRDLRIELPEKTGAAKGAPDWETHRDVLEAMARHRPSLAAAVEVAPPPGFRAVEQRIPRLPRRHSGRTAMPEIDNVRRAPQPPDDRDSPFAWSMEGYTGQPPAALVPRFWTPGWNSNEAINQFQIEVGGPLHGGDPGRRLLEPPEDPGLTPGDLEAAVPPGAAAEGDGLLLCATAEIFGSEPTSRRARGVAEMTPAPYLAVHPDTLAEADLEAGVTYRLRFVAPAAGSSGAGTPVGEARLTARAEADLPRHLVLVPAGYPETRWWQEPVTVEVQAVERVAAPEPLEAPRARDPRGGDHPTDTPAGRSGADPGNRPRRRGADRNGAARRRKPVQIETPRGTT